jgi:hypothetical protein
MKKKILLSLAALVAVSLGMVGMSAFEAHIINVTAHIENALTVPVEAEGLSFGTVFPEEVFYKDFDIRLSESFMSEPRVDDVEYMLRQKPKCGIPIPGTDPVQYSQFVQITDGPNGTFVCPIIKDAQGADVQSVQLPLLCPYLSKTELDANGATTTNAIPAFHGPLTDWNMQDTIDTQLSGRLSKADNKTSTSWLLDLHAPCFKGECAQDNVIPSDYQADPANESQLFGCDLWIEVTNISIPPDKALLTVIKHVINDDEGQLDASDFTMHVTGTNVSDPTFLGEENPGTDVILDAGLYSVSEDPVAGYASSTSADCSGTIAIGEHKTCTITNNDIAALEGTLTVIKVVVNNEIGAKAAGDFQMTIDDGNVNQNQVYPVSVGNHTVSEADDFGYDVTYSAECPAGVADVANGEDVICTVTNTMPFGTITVTKIVTNDNGGLLTVGNFTLKIDGTIVTSGTPKNVAVGAHNVSEVGVFGYSAAVSGDCNVTGDVIVAAGESKTCTITNNDISPIITLVKNVIGGSALPDDFDVSIDHVVKVSGSSNPVSANAAHIIDEEVIVSGYNFTSITGSSFLGVPCPASLEGTITLLPGDVATCTITNTH